MPQMTRGSMMTHAIISHADISSGRWRSLLILDIARLSSLHFFDYIIAHFTHFVQKIFLDIFLVL